MFNQVDDTLTHVFKYYDTSAVRSASLEKLTKLLDDNDEKIIKKAAHTRWLSHLSAVTSLRDTYSAVLVDMETAVECGSDRFRVGSGPSVAGLLKTLITYQTINIIHFLCDALKPVTPLALTFEKNDVDLSVVYLRIKSTVKLQWLEH